MKKCVTLVLKIFLILLFTLATVESVDLHWILDQTLDVYAPVSSALGEGPCRAQGLAYKQAVKDGNQWALNMFDSSSKIPSGVLTGNLLQFGNFDQCLEVHHADAVNGEITGQHCKVLFGADNFFTSKTIPERALKFKTYRSEYFEMTRLLNQLKTAEALSKMGATLSVCVPAACSPRDLQLHLRSALRGWLGDAVNVTVAHDACRAKSVDTQTSVSNPPSAATLIAKFVITLIFVGTAYDLLAPQKSRIEVLVAFSAAANLKALTKPLTSVNALPVLDGIRVLGIFLVMMLHLFNIFLLYSPKINFHENLKNEGSMYHIAFTNGSLGVDSFLLLGGTLIAYNYMSDRKKGLNIDVIKMYIRRYIRITPVMFGVTIIKMLLWNRNYRATHSEEQPRESQQVDVCTNSWWVQYLYITNVVPGFECVGELWYLSLDMQLVWLSPLLLYPLWRWPRIGKNIIGTLVVAGIALNFSIVFSWVANNPQHLLNNNNDQRKNLVYLLYTFTYTHFGPWFIGLILGHALHEAAKSPRRIPKKQVALGWLLSVCLTLSSILYTHKFYQPDLPYNKLVDPLYLAGTSSAWALGVAIMILLCVKGNGGPVNAFLSSPLFLVPSRLTFCTFLSHCTVFFTYYEYRRHPVRYDDVTMLVEFIGLSVISFISAFFVYIVVEAPTTALGRFFIDWIDKKNHKQRTTLEYWCPTSKFEVKMKLNETMK